MSDVSKHTAVLQDLKNGAIRTLGVSIGQVTITPGLKIAKAETHQAPKLTAPSDLPKDSSYAVICLDLDAPFISWNFMSPIAHFIQTDLKASQVEGGVLELKSGEPTIGPWVGAGPPPGAQPHRYVFYLYEQKGTDSSIASKIKPFSTTQRFRVDFDALVKKLGLGEIIAVNYFVSN
ncbi:hypothetical protein TMatcc_008082 [Talaromyces marneffei ATCC 18224]|uniref:Phosphatidylethanolamine-binding protein, putative n=2 Tax=Talaromyces marneffei TaxID=37727 RepID=B6QEK4_TALMQ|nr:phosphatidylethanolamine-binding protein, putative [Talaromyces marneffei ATCC 18224]KAE8552554.1 hypothetical protein EYB25_003932 [Talaromyces marneffei]